jgi:LysR family transcriptional regulator, benzoate and cis,cis-muconate-responsive activator of ben and cat genes
MDLRQIRYFLALATELNYTRAASQLNISQPPLTRHIQQLEHSIGVMLFDRSTRGVALTQAGKIFLEEARKIVALADQAVNKTKLAHQGQIGRLDIGIFGSSTISVIPTLLTELRKSYPDIIISLQNTTKTQQIDGVREKHLDIGFNRIYPSVPDLAVETVMIEDLYVALHKDHPFANNQTIEVKDLVHQPFILFPNNVRPSFADTVIMLCSNAGFTPNVVHDVEDIFTAIALISAGLGIAIVPESAISLRLSNVRYYLLDAKEAKVDLSCVYRPDNKSPALLAFLEAVHLLRSGKLKLIA